MTSFLASKRMRPFVLALTAFLITIPSAANAVFVSLSLSGPSNIVVGDSATLTAVINDTGYGTFPFISPDEIGSDLWWEFATSLNFTFHSGDGQTYISSYTPPVGSPFQLAAFSHSFTYSVVGAYVPDFSVTVTGHFRNTVATAYTFPFSYAADSQFYLGDAGTSLNVASVTVPEPASIALIGLGLLGLGFSRRKKA